MTLFNERQRYIGLMLVFVNMLSPILGQHFPSTVQYKAKKLYEMQLDLEPTSVKILRDPRYSSEVTPVFDLAFMAFQPRSEIRKISDLTVRVNEPQEMADYARTITGEIHIPVPNNVGVLPPNTLDRQPPYVWWVAAGALGPSSAFASSTGAIYLIDKSKPTEWKPVPIYRENNVGFSHVEWIDMDLDGKKDCVTIKGQSNRGQLIWLRQPITDSGTWQAFPISNVTVDVGGTDFKMMRVKVPRRPNKERVLFIVAGLRTATLTAYWVDDEDNDWTQVNRIQSTIIARSESYVSVEIVDINADGRDDILTSAAAAANRPGRLLAFELPKAGFGTGGEWRKRILNEWTTPATNYRTITPGPAYVFWIQTRERQASKKPHILVSGADDGKAYIVSPKSWSPYQWDYSESTIFSGDKSVGIPAIHDVDGDGKAEIFIPEGRTIHVMKYQIDNASCRTRHSWTVQFILMFFAIYLIKYSFM
ncbi:unnamed protein product [Clavelina lepadiformis]|uniref:VCBS repeat-containing protein n=1 Tax=Clavelina lepadiformis TaxID=159417 RepID=A0ABP0H019_CLALP